MAFDGQAPPSSSEGDPLAPQELAELSALADGTLDPSRRAEVERRIAASAQLRALYEREREVVAVLHQARRVDRAPPELRRRVASPARAARRPRRLGRVGIGFGAAAAAGVAAALALVLALPAGTPGAPSVSEAAALAQRGSAGPAPAPDPAKPGRLRADIQEVYFPNWARTFHWRAVGQRTDRLHGRQALTVYYAAPDGRRVAYTIVDAPALRTPAGKLTRRGDYTLITLTHGGRTIVTWRRKGRTCVLSATNTPGPVLTRLAAWRARGERS